MTSNSFKGLLPKTVYVNGLPSSWCIAINGIKLFLGTFIHNSML